MQLILRSISNTGRARLQGYLHKWQHLSVLIGCALYVDVLKPPYFSLNLQKENLDVVIALKLTLKNGQQSSLLSEKITTKEANSEYQGAILKSSTSSTLRSCQDQALCDLLQVENFV